VPGSPLRASAVKDETRRSGGTKNEGMKKVIRKIVQTRTLLKDYGFYASVVEGFYFLKVYMCYHG